MSMPIEETLSTNNLNVISDLIVKMQENNPTYTNYYVNYRRPLDTKIILSASVNQTNDYNQFMNPYYYCSIQLLDSSNQEYTSQTFDFTAAMNSCSQETTGSMDIPLTYNSSSSIYSKIASNKYNDNYLDIQRYSTIIQPSPSPEPEEPTGGGFDSINPYFWILPSFILMLIFMYKFLDKIFATGK